MPRHFSRSNGSASMPHRVVSTESYWSQVVAMRAQAQRPIVRYRTAVVVVAELIVAATIVLLICGLVGGRALFLDIAFALVLAITALVSLTLLASACEAGMRVWQQGDNR